MPKVSVNIPTYNRVNYLKYSIESVLHQTYRDFELIISDDGSTDDTPNLIKQYQDPRIIYLQHPQNIGRSRNMRSGFEKATGEYFIKFDDDDGLTPDFLGKTVNILDRYPEVDFVCTNHWIINSKNQREETATQANSARWGKDKLSEGILKDTLWQAFYYQSLQVGSTLFRRNCLEAVDYMRPEADGCEDFDLLVRLALNNYIGYFLPEYLMEYRFHGGQTSLAQNLHFLKTKLFCLESYHFEDSTLEEYRLNRIAQTQLGLGLRLLEKGENQNGRNLIQQSTKLLGNSSRSTLGLGLSYIPYSLRQFAFETFRKLRSKDYTEQVRDQP